MGTPLPVNVCVHRTTTATPSDVFNLITDVTRMPQWSPETIAATWLDGASGPAVGVRFKGTNKLGKNTWSTKPKITVFEPGRRFEFEVPGKSGPTWSYQLQAVEGGATRITETVSQQRPSPALIRFFQRRAGVTDRSANLRQAMETTLQRLCVAAEQTPSDSVATSN